MPNPGPFELAFAEPGDPPGLDRRPMGGNVNLMAPGTSSPLGTVAGPRAEDYARLMQYLTQGKHEGGPAARRAEAGMFAGPRDVTDDQAGIGTGPMRQGGLIGMLAALGIIK